MFLGPWASVEFFFETSMKKIPLVFQCTLCLYPNSMDEKRSPLQLHCSREGNEMGQIRDVKIMEDLAGVWLSKKQ